MTDTTTISNTTSVTDITTVTNDGAIAEEINSDNFLIYPNPIKDNATIKLPDAVEIKQIDIINVYERTVRFIDNVYRNIVLIQRENLPNGLFFIRIWTKKTYLKKVLII